jgi:transposase InsO family protein
MAQQRSAAPTRHGDAGRKGLPKKRWRCFLSSRPEARSSPSRPDRGPYDIQKATTIQRRRGKLRVADIKDVRSWQGWLYLVAVIDYYSRRVVGWSMRADPRGRARRRRTRDGCGAATTESRARVTPIKARSTSRWSSVSVAGTAGVQISMGSKGDAYDNAVAESFFASLEKDLLRRSSVTTRHSPRHTQTVCTSPFGLTAVFTSTSNEPMSSRCDSRARARVPL